MPVSKIFVLRSDRLGDVVLSSGYLASLAESFPDQAVELWLAPETAVCSQILHPRITVRKLPFDRYLRSGVTAVLRWLEALQVDNYAFAVIPQFTLGFPEIVALGYLDLGTRWGFLNRQLGVRPEWIYRELGPPRRPEADWIDLGVTVDPFLHEVEKYRLLAHEQMFQHADMEPRLFGVCKGADSLGLLIWPGSGAECRRWPAERFAAVAESLEPIKVTIGTVTGETRPADELFQCFQEAGIPAEISSRDPEDLRGTAQWLTGFGRLLTNDTGVAHLAAAGGIEVVAVSPSQYQGRFAVFGRKALTIFADVPCRRCAGVCIFNCTSYPCVTEINPSSVAALVQENRRGNYYLPPSSTFFAPDRLFRSLIEARHNDAEAAEARNVEFDLALRSAQRQLGDAEQQRDQAQRVCRETEKQRDAWMAQCREAESGRDESVNRLHAAEAQKHRWEDLCHQAEQQRDTRTAQGREAERERDESLDRLRAAETQRHHWVDLCQQAEQQRDTWRAQCREAERQRDKTVECTNATEQERDKWQDLCHEAERQRDAWAAQCHQAERQRNEWEALCHTAESGREDWKVRCEEVERAEQELRSLSNVDRKRLERIIELHPWTIHAASTTNSVPRISVITPSFQKGRFIEQTIQSVLDQGYPNFEHIVVDGGSSDQTLEILKRFPHLRWISEPDRGQAHAINKGLMISTGDIVAYLNADDVYRSGAFSEVSRFFGENPAARIVVGDCDYIDDQSNAIGHLRAKYGKLQDLIAYWGWDKWYCIPQQSVFWRKDLLADTGLFDVSLQMVMDYDMWLRVAELTHIHVLHRTLAAFRLTPDTKTAASTHLMYYEEFHTSRKFWRNLPLGRRVRISIEARRHLSAKLLDVAEHFSLNGLERGTIPSLVLGSMRRWPICVFYPRMICTVGELITSKSASQRIIKIAHRKYLGLKWRIRQRCRGEG